MFLCFHNLLCYMVGRFGRGGGKGGGGKGGCCGWLRKGGGGCPQSLRTLKVRAIIRSIVQTEPGHVAPSPSAGGCWFCPPNGKCLIAWIRRTRAKLSFDTGASSARSRSAPSMYGLAVRTFFHWPRLVTSSKLRRSKVARWLRLF